MQKLSEKFSSILKTIFGGKKIPDAPDPQAASQELNQTGSRSRRAARNIGVSLVSLKTRFSSFSSGLSRQQVGAFGKKALGKARVPLVIGGAIVGGIVGGVARAGWWGIRKTVGVVGWALSKWKAVAVVGGLIAAVGIYRAGELQDMRRKKSMPKPPNVVDHDYIVGKPLKKVPVHDCYLPDQNFNPGAQLYRVTDFEGEGSEPPSGKIWAYVPEHYRMANQTPGACRVAVSPDSLKTFAEYKKTGLQTTERAATKETPAGASPRVNPSSQAPSGTGATGSSAAGKAGVKGVAPEKKTGPQVPVRPEEKKPSTPPKKNDPRYEMV